MYAAAACNQTTPSVLITHLYSILGQMFMDMESKNYCLQNDKYRKFEVNCIKMNRDKIGTQTCYIH